MKTVRLFRDHDISNTDKTNTDTEKDKGDAVPICIIFTNFHS